MSQDGDHSDDDHGDDRALAGEYALGLLSVVDARAFEDRMGREPELRALYASWVEGLVGLTAGKDVTAPAAVWQGIEQTLFAEEKRSLWRRLGIGQAILGATMAAGIAYAVINGGWMVPATPTLQAEIVAEDNSLVVQARYDADARELHLTHTAGSIAAGRAQELWLIAGQNAPVSLGLLSGSGQTVLVVSASLVAAIPGGVLAISDEPPGGSPTGAPTGAVLAVGPITEL